jgi:hypothetical protein
MANDVFDIKTDLSIRYYNATISAYVEIVADSFEVDIDRGINVENGIFADGDIGVATVRMVKSSLADFLGTPGYKANDYLEIRYRPAPDTSPSLYNYLFTGFIQNVSMSYVNESGVLQIELTVNDVMKTYLNTQLASFSITGTTTARSFRNCMINLTNAINASVTFPTAILPAGIPLVPAGAGASSTTQYANTWLNTSSGEILSRFIDAELGWVWSALNQPKVQYLARTDVAALRAITYNSSSPTVSNVHYRNLIANGNFEVDVAGWSTVTASMTLTRNTTQFYMGVASMRVATTLVSTADYIVDTNTTMTVNPLDKLKASVWVRRETNTPRASVIITYYNSGGTSLGQSTGVVTSISTTRWEEVTVTGVAPAGTVRAKVSIVGDRDLTSSASMFVDNAKLENLTAISTNHFCLDNIVLKYDSDLLVNKVKVTESISTSSATATNAASITANGEQSGQYTVTYDAAGSPTTLANLATRIANSASIKQVQQVTVPVIRDDGTVSAIADYDIAYTLQVEFAQDPLTALQVVSLVSRINHVITPQHWEMNIGLWRAI